MTNTEISRQLIQDVIDMANIAAEIEDSYPGRGMYGSTCFGVIFEERDGRDSFFTALGMFAAQQADYDEPDMDEDLPFELARNAQTDSMGLGTIVYFPRYKLVD